MEYAIVDIETTGGNAFGSRITEVAIIIHDGKNELHRFESLVNPEMEIPVFVSILTGINQEMVQDAPVFEDIAEEVYHLLKDRIFVAHNVNFDYSFIHHQLELCGLRWTAPKLCTVRLSRKIKPGLPSYSLGNLCTSLQIPLLNRHRAMGDAEATALLFSKLVAWDKNNNIDFMLKKSSREQSLPPHLPKEVFDALPDCTGIYFFHNKSGKIIYVGKALNIKIRVAQHFSGNDIYSKRQNFLKSIYNITYQATGTELIALLKEYMAIKKHWPKYNKALKNEEPRFSLFHYEGTDGYHYLSLGKINRQIQGVKNFYREIDAQNFLRSRMKQYQLDIRFCRFDTTQKPPAHLEAPLPDKTEYNNKVKALIASISLQNEEVLILDKGRKSEEQSVVWIENNQLKRIGYTPQQFEISAILESKDIFEPCSSSFYLMNLIDNYMEKFPEKILNIAQNNYATSVEKP